MKISEAVEILRHKQADAQLQISNGCVGGQYEDIVKAIDEIVNDIDLLVVNKFRPFVSEKRTYLPEAINILESEKQDIIFSILVTEDDQKFIENIKKMQNFVLAVDTALFLVKRYNYLFVDDKSAKDLKVHIKEIKIDEIILKYGQAQKFAQIKQHMEVCYEDNVNDEFVAMQLIEIGMNSYKFL